MINGYISNEFYIPAPSLQFTGTKELMAEYQKRAPGLGIDPLGYTYPPYAYAAGQILAQGRDRDEVDSMTTSSPTTSGQTRSTRSSGRSRSDRTASGRSRASSTPSSRT